MCPRKLTVIIISYEFKAIICLYNFSSFWGFPGGSAVKNPPAKEETWVWSLDREYPLEKEMAAHSSILAWEIPWTEEPGRLQSMGLQRVGPNLATKQQQDFCNREEKYT